MTNKDLPYSKEWLVLNDLANGVTIERSLSAKNDVTLNNKIHWFLYNGAAGIIAMIKEVYGQEAVSEFYNFLDYFISNPDTLGHYWHSYKIIEDTKKIKEASQGMKFEKYIRKLKKELIQLDEKKGRAIDK